MTIRTTTTLARLSGILSVASVPMLAFAAPGDIGGATVGAYLSSIIGFINIYLVPFIFAIAFIVFIWGVFQYFIAGGADEEKRKQGRDLVFWGVIAFVVMSSVWGLVNLVRGTLNFQNGNTPPLPTFTNTSAPAPKP